MTLKEEAFTLKPPPLLPKSREREEENEEETARAIHTSMGRSGSHAAAQ